MRLLTHNMLQCPRTRAYPLQLEIETCDEVDVEFSAAFVRRMLPRLDWDVFLAAAKQLPDPELVNQLPAEPPSDETPDDADVLMAIHRAMMQYHVVEGMLSVEGASYKVSNGVPNMVITEVRKEDDQADVDVGQGENAGEAAGEDADPMQEDAEMGE